MNRRNFIRGMVAAAAVVASGASVFARQGDAETAEGTEVVYLRSGERLSGKRFTRPITVRYGDGAVIENCTFIGPPGECAVNFEPMRGAREAIVRNCTFTSTTLIGSFSFYSSAQFSM